jgi:hypothetical protein
MKKPDAPYVHKIGWRCRCRDYTMETQHAALEAYGCRSIYAETDGDNVEHALNGLRAGNEFVVHGLARLTTDRREALAIMKRIHKIGAKLFDTTAQSYVDPGCFAAAFEMIRDVNSEAWMSSRAEASRRGKLASHAKKLAKLGKAEALYIWQDYRKSGNEASQIIGLSVSSCYNWLGERGVKTGRKPKKT